MKKIKLSNLLYQPPKTATALIREADKKRIAEALHQKKEQELLAQIRALAATLNNP